jgi:hypothetical protein
MLALTDETIRTYAPSVFASQPWDRMSARYRMLPTIAVVDQLREHGFFPVRATQSRCRIPGKDAFTRHLVRFRREADLDAATRSEVVELCLVNAHDGTSAYKFMAGLHRVIWTNGLISEGEDHGSISVRHSSGNDWRSQVIDATFTVLGQAEESLKTAEAWKALPLTPSQQLAYGEAALELRTSSITAPALLAPHRNEDAPMSDGSRDLWRTYNTVQESVMKGGIRGKAATGRRITTKPVKSVSSEVALNRPSGSWRQSWLKPSPDHHSGRQGSRLISRFTQPYPEIFEPCSISCFPVPSGPNP